MSITITEALAEIKTVAKRIDKKREFIAGYIARQDGIRDPLEKDGGAMKVIEQERQAIADLEQRLIALRRGISLANDATSVTILGQTRSISEWLTWRRDVAPGQRAFLNKMQQVLAQIRSKAQQQGAAIVSATATTADTKPSDFVVNIDERKLGDEIEAIEDPFGQLDGQLSLKSATDFIVE
jgi:hypothetical protein